MPLLYFNSQQFPKTCAGTRSGPLFLDCIESTYARIDTFISVGQLFTRLRKSHHDILGAVLIISSISELMDLIRHQELLEDIPISLILPIDDPEMNSLGHVLGPRYLASVDGNDMEIREVLIHFVQKLKEQLQNVICRGTTQTDSEG